MAKQEVRCYSKNCTELENRLSDWFRDNMPNEDWGLQPENIHSLQEHVDGYINQREAYTNNDPELETLIDDFLRIAVSDIEGTFEYTTSGYDIVIKALTTFGL